MDAETVDGLFPSPLKILLIENHQPVVNSIRDMAKDCIVTAVRSLSDIVEQSRIRQFDLVMLDISLLDGNGIETVRKVKETDSTVPIIVLAGFSDKKAAIEAVTSGAVDYLVKEQMNQDTLIRSIRYAVAHGRIAEELDKSREKTEAVKNEIELRVIERTAELARENEILSSEIKVREAKEAELEESNQALNEFAAEASHDLQEPLRKAETFGTMLEKKMGDSMDGQAKTYLSRLLDSIRRMRYLVTSLLEYSRLSSGPLSFRKTDCNTLIHDVLSDLEILVSETGAKITVEPLPAIECNRDLMRRLFQNLLQNALKFHPPDKAPVIRIYSPSSDPDDDHHTLLIEDNGIGFEERYLNKIFAPFRRLHGKESPYAGNGLGLAICKKIAARHNGTITAKSIPGKGSTFAVTLPAKQ